MNIKVVLRPGEFTSFTSYYLESLWGKYFDLEWYDETRTYNPGTVFVIWWMNADSEWAKKQAELGHCILVDNLWEMPSKHNDYYWIENPNWFWYNESLWWRALGYHEYQAREKFKYCALMPMRKSKPERDYILKKMDNVKDSLLWSYNNRHLPNDTADIELRQRYVNREWYDTTWSSLVVETQVEETVFLTEKIFKPIAFNHPFQVISAPGTLTRLSNLGFETYSNLFNEIYDQLDNFDQRLDVIINNLRSIELKSYDALTQAKLNYNRQRFFNQHLVEERIISEIVNPILNYVENFKR